MLDRWTERERSIKRNQIGFRDEEIVIMMEKNEVSCEANCENNKTQTIYWKRYCIPFYLPYFLFLLVQKKQLRFLSIVFARYFRCIYFNHVIRANVQNFLLDRLDFF